MILSTPDRKVPMCPLTGLPASYRDPRTMTPYSSLAAYRTLTALVEQTFPWDPTHCVFTGVNGFGLQQELEDRQLSRGKGKASASGAQSAGEKPSGNSWAARSRGRSESETAGSAAPSPASTSGPVAGSSARPPFSHRTSQGSAASSGPAKASPSAAPRSKAKASTSRAKKPPQSAEAPGPFSVAATGTVSSSVE